MSEYVREKVLRVPFEENKHKFKFDYEKDDMIWSLVYAWPEIWGCGEVGKFQFSYGEPSGYFIDYVLDSEYGCDCGDWGKVRDLRPTEMEKYASKFAEVFEDLDMDEVRLVEYCYYNGCDAPAYYEYIEDPFYDEV